MKYNNIIRVCSNYLTAVALFLSTIYYVLSQNKPIFIEILNWISFFWSLISSCLRTHMV